MSDHFFFFFDMSAQEEEGEFKLVTSILLGMVPTNWTTYWGRVTIFTQTQMLLVPLKICAIQLLL